MTTCFSLLAMDRRTLLSGLLACTFTPHARAGEQPWQARLLKGGFDGKAWWAGLQVSLLPGWKTYWRVPGDGGIAPQLDVSGDNVERHEVFYPLPRRYEDEAGLTLGYKDEVVFPMAILPRDAGKPVALTLKAFFGVCDVVCIPAQFEAATGFDGAASDAPDQALISRWQRLVPAPATEGPITRARVKTTEGKLQLELDRQEAIGDIFVEGGPTQFFGTPANMRGFSVLSVHGAKTEAELRGSKLRITIDAASGPVEQWVTVE